MSQTFESISDDLATWLEDQPVFFVATAPRGDEGLLNCSPKGNRREFSVTGAHSVAYLDQTGSGIETVAHLGENGRVVVMFCAFSGPPRIVRLHGTGRFVGLASPEFETLSANFPGANGVGVRSIIAIDVRRVSDSCGYGVPFMTFESHRPTMDQWSSRKGPEGIRTYWSAKNRTSLDGLDGLT